MPSKLRDHLLAIVKAGLHVGWPEWGGALASLIEDYVPTSDERATRSFIESFGRRLTALEGRVDGDVLVEDDFKEQFAELYKAARAITERTARAEKLEAAASLLANLFLKPSDPAKVSFTELDHLMRCVEYLSSGAIMVLGAAREVAKTIQADPNDNSRIVFSDLQRKTDMEASLLMALVAELDKVNLLRIASIPSVSMPLYGNYPLLLTPLGKRFIQHIETTAKS